MHRVRKFVPRAAVKRAHLRCIAIVKTYKAVKL